MLVGPRAPATVQPLIDSASASRPQAGGTTPARPGARVTSSCEGPPPRVRGPPEMLGKPRSGHARTRPPGRSGSIGGPRVGPGSWPRRKRGTTWARRRRNSAFLEAPWLAPETLRGPLNIDGPPEYYDKNRVEGRCTPHRTTATSHAESQRAVVRLVARPENRPTWRGQAARGRPRKSGGPPAATEQFGLPKPARRDPPARPPCSSVARHARREPRRLRSTREAGPRPDARSATHSLADQPC